MVSAFRKMRYSGKKAIALLMAVLILFSVSIAALTALATGSASAAGDDYLYIPVSLYDYKYNNQVETSGAAPDAGTRPMREPALAGSQISFHTADSTSRLRAAVIIPRFISETFLTGTALSSLPILNMAQTLQTRETTTRPLWDSSTIH